MSQPPYGPPAGPAPWPGQGQPAPKGPSRLPAIIAIAIALVAVAVAAAAWFRPAPEPEAPAPKTYSAQEVADAEKAVCEAFAQTETALDTNNRRAAGNSADDLAVIANTRIAIHAASTLLSLTLNNEPATPKELASRVADLARQYQSMLLDQISEKDTGELNSQYHTTDLLVARVSQACK